MKLNHAQTRMLSASRTGSQADGTLLSSGGPSAQPVQNPLSGQAMPASIYLCDYVITYEMLNDECHEDS